MASALTLVVIGRWGGPAASAEGALRTVARAAFGPVESAGDTAFRPLRGAAAALRRGGDLARAEAGLAGCIIGRALYEGQLRLREIAVTLAGK